MEQSLDNLNEMLFNGILIVLPFVDRRQLLLNSIFFGSLKSMRTFLDRLHDLKLNEVALRKNEISENNIDIDKKAESNSSLVENDYQLYQAINVLKGLSIHLKKAG